jgi:ERCC4-type nuclease
MTTTSRSTSRKSPSDPLVQVLVDSREPDWVRALPFGGAHVVPALIEAGDLLAMTAGGAAVLVERKTAGDLLSSIKDGRLIAQAAAMREVTEWAYLVVTEPMYPGRFGQVLFQPTRGRTMALRETAWGWHALQGALTTVQDLGVGVVWCGGDDHFEATALWLFERERGPVAVPRRTGLPLPEEESILCALPGVGPERARELLRACGSVAWALYALTEQPGAGAYKKSVVGVGPKTRLEVRRALGLKDGEALIPLTEGQEAPEEPT